MTEFYLIDELKKFLEGVMRGELLSTPVNDEKREEGSLWDEPEQHEEDSVLSSVQVYGGFLPPKLADEQNHPFIYVRPTSSTVDAGRTEVTVVITVGVYASDLKGYIDAMHVTRRVTSALNALKNNVLADKFERDTSMSWTWNTTDDQPFWAVDMTTTWWIYTDRGLNEKWL